MVSRSCVFNVRLDLDISSFPFADGLFTRSVWGEEDMFND
jgi:hypothetical protein